MKYLLDVNALVAWAHSGTADKHARLHAWKARINASDLGTCAICDLGFLRISMSAYGYDLASAESALDKIRATATAYIADLPPPRLARWVLSHKHTTDAYLCQLAAAHGMKLATFDEAIKDSAAFLIP